MRDYVIMTDSCCDLNAAEVAELGITVVPLTFTVDGMSFADTPDHKDMAPDDFFARISTGAKCSTAAVNVGQYADAMRAIVEAGRDILCICFSSALSTTYQSACIAAEDLAAEHPEAKITVVDSLCASRGQGMLVWRAVQHRRETEADIDTLADFVRAATGDQCHWFMVDDLAQLKRGGRISAAAALAGTVLGIKPVLQCDREGRLIPMSKARGVKAALRALVDEMEKRAVTLSSEQTVFICHANCPDYVEYVSGLLRERFGITDIRADFIGPVIGSHTGGGTLGLFFVGKER